MQMKEYQAAAQQTAVYDMKVIYPALGLAGEAGEVSDKIKKLIRDQDYVPGNHIARWDREAILLELGDVLWYIQALAHDLGSNIEEVAQMNIDKLYKRQERGTIHGSGDYR